MSEEPNQINRLTNEAVDYVDMRIDAAKLTIIENLTVVFNNLLGIFLFILFISLALLMFAGAGVYFLSLWFDSVGLAFLCVGGLFMILSFVLYLLKDKLFNNQLVNMFTSIFFNPNNKFR